MPFTPDAPFPKTSGNPIRSKDWNDAITEVQRLDTAKANRAGDTFTGPLAVQAAAGDKFGVTVGGKGPGAQQQLGLQVSADATLRGADRLNLHKFGTDGDYQTLHKASGHYGRNTLALHCEQADALGFYSTGWTPLFEVAGGSGDTWVRGRLDAGNSELHFTKTDHNWNSSSDQLGFATIQNGASHNALMLVGRAVTVNPLHRVVSVWDELNVFGPLNVHGNVAADGQITSPMFGVQHVLNNRAGALPLTANFVTGGGVIVLFASGSGWSGSGPAQIGMLVRVDNVDRAWVMSFTNEINSHKTFSSNPIVIAGLGGGTHSVQLVARAGTSTDYNDFFSVTVLELPFTGAR